MFGFHDWMGNALSETHAVRVRLRAALGDFDTRYRSSRGNSIGKHPTDYSGGLTVLIQTYLFVFLYLD